MIKILFCKNFVQYVAVGGVLSMYLVSVLNYVFNLYLKIMNFSQICYSDF